MDELLCQNESCRSANAAEESGANLRLWAVQTDIIVTSATIGGLPKLSVAIYIQQIIFTPRGEEKLVSKIARELDLRTMSSKLCC